MAEFNEKVIREFADAILNKEIIEKSVKKISEEAVHTRTSLRFDNSAFEIYFKARDGYNIIANGFSMQLSRLNLIEEESLELLCCIEGVIAKATARKYAEAKEAHTKEILK